MYFDTLQNMKQEVKLSGNQNKNRKEPMTK